MSKARDLADLIAAGNPLADGAISVAEISDLTASAAEINKLDGLVASAAELDNVVGTTSALQTQLDNISVTSGSLTKSFASGETASITLAQAISPAPVVSVIKEVPQTGISSKGAWDVASDGGNYERQDTAYDTTLAINPVNNDFSIVNPNGGSLSTTLSTNHAANDFTYEAWIKPTGSDSYMGIIGRGDGFGHLYIRPSGSNYYLSWYEGSERLTSTADLTNGTWHHVAAVRSSGVLKLYIDGSESGSVSYTTNLSQTSLYISAANATTSENFKGGIYKPHVINSAKYTSEFSPSVVYQEEADTVLFVTASTGNVFTDSEGNTLSNYATVQSTQDAAPYGDILQLGSGSFASTDVGKQIEGNGGKAILTATDGSYSVVTAFNDSSTIASGDWGMFATTFDAANGVTMPRMVYQQSTGYEYDSPSYIGKSTAASVPNQAEDLYVTPDGTKLFFSDSTQVNVYTLTTPYDIDSAVYQETHTYGQGVFSSGQSGSTKGFDFSPNGLVFIYGENSNGNVWRFTLSTAFDLTTASYSNNVSVSLSEGVKFFENGYSIIVDKGSESQKYNLPNQYNIANASYAAQIISHTSNVYGSSVSSDGVYAYTAYDNGNTLKIYELSTPNNLSSASLIKTIDTSSVAGSLTGVVTSSDGKYLYASDRSPNGILTYLTGTEELVAQPTAQYSPVITNASGQINTAFWTDINSMTADQSANDGSVFYAVSTDDRTTWSVIKEGDGVRPIVRDNAGTWEYNTAVDVAGYAISSATYDNVSYGINPAVHDDLNGMVFSADGTKMYTIGPNTNSIYQHSLSSAFDISTASYNNVSLNINGVDTAGIAIAFKPDGTKMYMSGGTNDRLYQFSLSTAYDLSTATYDNIFTTIGGAFPYQVVFKSDGTKAFLVKDGGEGVIEYTMSTPWDITTFSQTDYFALDSFEINPRSIFITPNGTRMFIIGTDSDSVLQFSMSTAFDLTTVSYDNVSFSVASQDTAPTAVSFNSNGTKMFILGYSFGVFQYTTSAESYTTSTTWTSATGNTELDALQEALTEVSINRMDKAQLEAVTDPNHYTLGDSLDLMIGLYMPSAGTSPTSDGVSINYDAEALNQGAVLGTDYDYDFPDSTTVRVTSNAAQNLKVRVV